MVGAGCMGLKVGWGDDRSPEWQGARLGGAGCGVVSVVNGVGWGDDRLSGGYLGRLGVGLRGFK